MFKPNFVIEDKILTNPNSKFRPRPNFGGDSGSHRQRFGVHVARLQQALVYRCSLIFAKRPFLSLLLVDVESLARSWSLLFFSDPTFVSKFVRASTSSIFVIVLKKGIWEQLQRVTLNKIEMDKTVREGDRNEVTRPPLGEQQRNVNIAMIEDKPYLSVIDKMQRLSI